MPCLWLGPMINAIYFLWFSLGHSRFGVCIYIEWLRLTTEIGVVFVPHEIALIAILANDIFKIIGDDETHSTLIFANGA